MNHKKELQWSLWVRIKRAVLASGCSGKASGLKSGREEKISMKRAGLPGLPKGPLMEPLWSLRYKIGG